LTEISSTLEHIVKLLFVKLGSNPETRPIVENIRVRLGDCYIAGVGESLQDVDTPYDELITSHYDGLFGSFRKFDLESLAMTPQLYDEVRTFEGQGLRMIERMKYYHQPDYDLPTSTPRFRDSFQARSDLFFRYCLFWDAVLRRYEFDAVITQNLSHMAWDLPLEKLCNLRAIPYLYFHEVGQWPRINYLGETVDELGDLTLGRHLKSMCEASWSPETPNRVVQHLGRIRGLTTVSDPLFGRLEPAPPAKFKTGPFASILRNGDVRQNLDGLGDITRAVSKKLSRLISSPISTSSKTRSTLVRAFRTSLSRKAEIQVAKPLDSSSPFVFFPLHFQPEASTGAKGRHFVEQREAAAMISQSLPEGWKLVIKEHPHQYRRLYDRKNFFWQRIASIPNVIVVRHDTDDRELVSLSEGVVSLSHSTIATRAWLSNVRTVFLAHSHLRSAPGVHMISSLDELRQVWRSPKPLLRDDELLEYLREVEDSTIECTLYGSPRYLPAEKQSEIIKRSQKNVTEVILAWLSLKGICQYP